MGWLHNRKLVESITDPSSRELSMSRIGMGIMVGMMVLIDLVSLYLMLAGRFQKEWFGPPGRDELFYGCVPWPGLLRQFQGRGPGELEG